MISKRELFFRHLAQTSDAPMALEVERAEGIYLYTPEGKRITDLISGIAVNNVGHRHPEVVKAVQEQMERYTHIMVYGEVIQAPQVLLGEKLASLLPPTLDTTYLVNSGSEANEGALKLARRYTGRSGIIHFANAYHGSTMGCLSIIGGAHYQQGYGPLIPDVQQLIFNEIAALEAITDKTAAVIAEVIQGEGGVRAATPEFLAALRSRCTDTGALLIFDEVQTGFGRTGKMFAFEHFGVIPDIITFAKGMGGGMPIGAFTASQKIMQVLQHNPVLGHITTFGGHPVSAAAALASIRVIENGKLDLEANHKGELFKQLLQNHEGVKEIRQHGLMIAVDLIPEIKTLYFIHKALSCGILTDWFLFCDHAFRIAPPLTISRDEIEEVTMTLKKVLSIIVGSEK
jgi:acetylornithine/succinyldiaminopimelate/putrescine aminotransferase